MMGRIVVINSHLSGSTGKIVLALAEAARKKGYEVFTVSAVHRKEKHIADNRHIYVGSVLDKKIHNILSELSGTNSCFSTLVTYKLIHQLRKLQPDFIHLHNIHSNFLNIKVLFKYIETEKIPVIWTLHDCWVFTGHCVYFDANNCEGWKHKCKKCLYYKEYPASLIDNAAYMYKLKERLFSCPQVKTIITPSNWLGGLVKQSFLGQKNIVTIYNGIDTSVFSPVKSDVRSRLGINESHIMILGVAMPWTYRKGPDIFKTLSEKIGDRFQIVIVGPDDKKVDWGSRIIRIPKTENQHMLAELYSASDVFVNPTREDNFPTVNIEALACGTPVISFNTGGSPEALDRTCGRIVDKEDVDGLIEAIYSFGKKSIQLSQYCRKIGMNYSVENQINNYLAVYEMYKNSDKRCNGE